MSYPEGRLARRALALASCLLLASSAGAAEEAEKSSLWDRARTRTAHAVKVTGDAVQRAANRTEQFLTSKEAARKVDAAERKVDRTASKAGAKLDKAAAKVDATAAKAGAAVDQARAVAKPASSGKGAQQTKAAPAAGGGFGDPLPASGGAAD